MPALLSYAFATQPDPLAASASATLTLGVSNLGRQLVTVTTITVTLPVGTAAKDLTADPSRIATPAPTGWNISQNGGSFTLTPDPAHASVGAQGLAFVFAGVAVNTQPGPCTVRIDELASSPSQPAGSNPTDVTLSKFYAGFTLSALIAHPVEVASGTGTTQLSWTGSPATYTLQYDPDGKALITVPVSNDGPLGVTNLTNPSGVVFTLNAEWTEPGQDQPSTAQRQVTVGVAPPDPVITSFTGTLTGAGTRSPQLTLAWSVTGVQSCSLSTAPSVLLAPTGSVHIAPSAATPLRATYTLSASNAAGTKTASSQIVITWAAQPNPVALSDSPTNITIPESGGPAYVCCWSSVVALDMAGFHVVGQTATQNTGASAVVSPDGSLLYQVNCQGVLQNAVTAYDAHTLQPAGQPIPVAGFLEQGTRCAISPDGSLLFVAHVISHAGGVSVVDTRARTELAPIAAAMDAAAFSPDGSVALVSEIGGSVAVIDPAARTVIGSVAIGNDAMDIPFSPDGARAYVISGGGVQAIDVAARTPLPPRAPLPGRYSALAVMPDGEHLVAAAAGSVVMLTANPLQVVSTVQLDGRSDVDVAVSPDGVVVLVSDSGAQTVTVVLPASVTGGVPAPHAELDGMRTEAGAAPALLTYAALTDPDPLRASASSTLTLVISNGTRQTITAGSIVVTLPVGTTAKALTANPSGIASVPANGWNIAQSGGTFTLTPQDGTAGKVAADGLAFVFANVAVNEQPGTCVVEIGETGSSASQPSAFRTAPIALSKFPARFELSPLSAIPTQIPPGASAMLMWRGSPATYTLSYDPNGARPVHAGVGNTGPYTAPNLTKSPSVTCTLEASVTVPGQDRPLTLQRQITVDVSTAAPVITSFTGTLSGGGGSPVLLTLAWSVQGTGLHCWFSGSPYEVAPAASATVPSAAMPRQRTYTLNASNGSGTVAATLEVRWTAKVTTIPLAETPENIAVAKDGARAYVCTERSVVAIDTTALAPAAPPKVFADALAFVTLSPDGTRLYVTSALRKTVTVLDARTLETVGPPIAVSVAPQRQGILAARAAVSPDGSRLFIPGGLGGNVVAVVDTVARTEVAAPRVSVPLAAAVTPDGEQVFVSSLTGSVHVLDAASLHQIGDPISAGNLAIALVAGPDGARAYVLESRLAEIVAIDAATRKAGPWIPVPSDAGRPPHALAITPDGAQLLCGGFSRLSLLDTDPLRLASTVAIGGTCNDVAVTEDGKTVLIAATGDRGSVLAYAPPYVEGGIPAKLTLYALPPS